MREHRIVSLRDAEEVGRAVPGALAAFPIHGMDRSAGSPVIPGNRIALQFDGPLTFEAWIEAIAGAKCFVHFENYILRDDRVGRAFREALVAKARQGIPVRVLYDWIGCWATPASYWRPFREAGVEVRAFNRPSVRDPYGLLQRDHRKVVCVDGRLAFVGGFCVGVEWAGTATEPPWRDTGVEIEGPAAAVAARSFERVWAMLGSPVPHDLCGEAEDQPAAGDVPVWVIEGAPGRSRVYRTIQLVAAHAQKRIWITDPYFVAPRPVAEALGAAARDGVDVRILLPAHNNWPWVASMSRGGYRFLLESGVRLFEWQGPMIHAKTAVADGIWSRVGSSNLNNASLLGNFEIDVGVLDEDLASQMEGLFLADMASSVEIVLPRAHMSLFRAAERSEEEEDEGPPKALLETVGKRTQQSPPRRKPGAKQGKGTGWKLANLIRAGSTLGSAIAGQRSLAREDRSLLGAVTLVLGALAAFAGFFPRYVGMLVAVIAGWLTITTGVRAFLQAREARLEERKLRKVYERLDEKVAGSVSVLLALTAGILSFLSPCVLPLVPSYLSFVTGMSLDDLQARSGDRAHVLTHALLFVSGFTVVFTLLGATASFLGLFAHAYESWIARIGGVLIIVFGLHLLGVFRIGALMREKRVHLADKPAGYMGTIVVGAAFGAGWTPCIGPVLGAILTLAGTRETVWSGVWLLLVYSAGLAIPFLLAALALDWFLAAFRRFRGWIPWMERASGALLVALGLLLVTGSFTVLTGWLNRFTPAFLLDRI